LSNGFLPSIGNLPSTHWKQGFQTLEARFPDFGSNLSTHQKQSIRWKWLLINGEEVKTIFRNFL